MRIVIIGGGPAGLWLAGSLCKHEVILIEKNKQLAKKLALTGNTRCNVTNNNQPNQFIEKLIGDKKFAHQFIHHFGPKEILSYFQSNNCPLKLEAFKYFPVSDKASDVIALLKSRMNHVHVQLDTEVVDIVVAGEGVQAIVTNKGEIRADAVVVATGGMTYPMTGSAGDGYKFFKGHQIEELYPMECGLTSNHTICKLLQGQSFDGVFKLNKKQYQGQFLMTHYGISGPLALELSPIISKQKIKELSISFLNHTNDEKLISHIRSYKYLNQALSVLFSSNFIKKIFSPELLNSRTNELSKVKLQDICNQLLHVKLTDVSARDFNTAFVTGGGLKLNDFYPHLESKHIKGLFALGEILNIHGPIGGYNITLCISQAQHIAEYLNKRETL